MNDSPGLDAITLSDTTAMVVNSRGDRGPARARRAREAGRQIAFTRWEESDGGWDVRPIGIYSMADGTVRGVGPLPREVRSRYPAPDDGSASPGEGFFFDWSPDGQSLLAYPSEATGHAILIDTLDGTWRALAPVLDALGAPARQGWQRLAP